MEQTETTVIPRPVGREMSERRFGLALVLPSLLVVGAVLLYPLAYSLGISFFNLDLLHQRTTFVGFGNYLSAVADPLFRLSLVNTIHFALIVVVASTSGGIAVALLLNEPFVGRGLARSLVILPWSLSQIVLGLVFGWIFNGSYGAFNGLLVELGLIRDYIGWFSTGFTAMSILALVFTWNVLPLFALLFLAALQAIPGDLYEAAKVDGANIVARFRYVTLPWLRSTLLLVLVIATLDGFLAFSLIYLLTGGGPGTQTSVLAFWGYDVTFTSFELGRGAAIFWILSMILFACSFVYMRAFRSEIEGGSHL